MYDVSPTGCGVDDPPPQPVINNAMAMPIDPIL
jgi:hypothetical protein